MGFVHPIPPPATLTLPQRWAACIAMAAILAAVLAVSVQRTHFGIGPESDFAGSFGPEAQRILAGRPLHLNFHPPGYSFALAVGHWLAGGWLAAGLLVSGLSALLLMAACFQSYQRTVGTAAAFGALAAIACSTPFFTFASSASSDMLFAALVYSVLALVALASRDRERAGVWVCTGLLAGLLLLTRTNGVVALAVFIVPFLTPDAPARRLRNFALLFAAFLVPTLLWVAYAGATNSPLWPVRNHMNLAVAAYADESGPFADLADLLDYRFGNIVDVLMYDPARMVSRFAERLLSLPRIIARSLTWLPLIVLAVPGSILVLWRHRSLPFLFTLLMLGGLTLLSGILAFQTRFYLVLIPFFGAMAGAAVGYALERFAAPRGLRVTSCAILLVIVAVVAVRAYLPVLPKLESTMQFEIGEAIPYVKRIVETDATIFARKHNLGFETGRTTKPVVNVPSIAALHDKLCAELEPGRAGYLYFGLMERRYLGQLHAELTPAKPVPWLEPVARGRRAEWSLYRFQPDSPERSPGSTCTVSVPAGT